MLGVLAPDEFDAEPITTHFEPGDALITCTDGAFERFDSKGTLAGFSTYQSIIESSDTSSVAAPETMLAVLDTLQDGQVEDDTVVLIASLPT